MPGTADRLALRRLDERRHVPAHAVVGFGVPEGSHQDIVRTGHRSGRPASGPACPAYAGRPVRSGPAAERFPISIVTGRSKSTCDRTVLSVKPSKASAAQSSTALATV